jgi:nitroreductase
MNLSEVLQFRYAVKKFDSEKKLSDEQVQKILEAANLTATSYGLQPFKILNIRDQIIREKISDGAFGQRQPAEASHLLIIAVRTDIDENYVINHVKHVAQVRNMSSEDTEKLKTMLLGSINGMSSEQKLIWSTKQCYIILGNLLTCCALEKIDSCPMEGFSSGKIDEILGLKEKNLHSLVMLPIGFRSGLDKYQFLKKVRKPLDEIVIKF